MGKVGRPVIVDAKVDSIFRKLESYLKQGLSLHKACLEAQIPKSTTYDLYQEYDEFAERIDACKNYHSLLIGDVFTKELERITKKQNKKGLTNYFYYRCDNPDCKFYGKSIRAHVIVDFVCEFLKDNKFTSKAVYGHYVEEMRSVIRDKELELESRRRSLQQIRRNLDNKIEKTKDLLRSETDTYIKGVFNTDLKDLDKKLKEADNQLEAIKKEMELNKKAILSYSQFLELFSELPVRIRKTKVLRELDFMIREIFLNFTIKDKIVASYQLNQPFDRFIKEAKIPSSRGPGN